MKYRLRIGITHPLPFLKNAGIYARDLNATDSTRWAGVKTQFFAFAETVSALTSGAFQVTPDGLKIKGFGFQLRLDPQ